MGDEKKSGRRRRRQKIAESYELNEQSNYDAIRTRISSFIRQIQKGCN